MMLESKRKVQSNNQGYPWITLDKKWTISNKIQKGDTLDCFAEDGVTVFLSPYHPFNDVKEVEELKALVRSWILRLKHKHEVIREKSTT